MRILYLGGSAHIHDFRFLEKLAGEGYETHVVTFEDAVKVKGCVYHKIEFDGIFFRSPVKLLKARKELLDIIKKVKPDVLHAGWIPSYGFLAATANFHPFLLMPWGSDILIKPYQLFNFKESVISIFNRVATNYVIRKADMIQCDAEHVKKEIVKLSRYLSKNIVVFPWGIDLNKFNPCINSRIKEELGWAGKTVLIMNRLFESVYGHEYFFRIIPDLIKENDDIRVLFCSRGSLENKYKIFVRENGLERYVHFAGFVNNEDLPKYLAASDIYVSASLSDGTSLSLLEAMACGLPVVVTDNPAIMEWVKERKNGFVVPRKESKVLKDKIIEMINNRGLLRKFSKKNIEIAKKRADWNKNFRKLEEMYRRLAE